MVTEIKRCRICGEAKLTEVFSLGELALSGLFPRTIESDPPSGPLTLVSCAGECGFVQLKHDYDREQFFQDSYGYCSGRNPAMVAHLRKSALEALAMARINSGAVVIDIGSNDGTLLWALAGKGLELYGVDPIAGRFAGRYPQGTALSSEFFPGPDLRRKLQGKKARIITSFALIYSTPDPLAMAREVRSLLGPEGIWVFEQSYLPLMLRSAAYDSICHEHVGYFSLRTLCWLLRNAGMKVVKLQLNDVNGGSIQITAAPLESHWAQAPELEEEIRREEEILSQRNSFSDFRRRVEKGRDELRALLERYRREGKRVSGVGASTKGNILLQYCELGPELISQIAEVSPEKYGHVTPGSHIPIVSEERDRDCSPDVRLILPWHFRSHFLEAERDFISRGGIVVFPLPVLEVIGEESR